MALFLQRARRIAWNIRDTSKNDTRSIDSGYAEMKTDRPSQQPREVQRLGRAAGFEKFAETLKRDGCVVVRDFTDLDTLAQANEEIRPYLERQLQDDAKVDGWMGRARTVTQLMRRSPTIRETFYTDNLYQLLCELFLATESITWSDNTMTTNTSHPLLSSAITFDMPLGASAQGFHRDDKYYHARHSSATEYDMGRDLLLGLFVAGNDGTAETATRVALGSHLWGDEKPPLGDDSDTPITDIVLKKGEALIMLGSLYYGGSTPDQSWTETAAGQLVHAMFSCAGVYRQEENPYLTYTSEEVRTYSSLVQERLGWKQKEPSLGWVDLRSPEFLLQA